MFDQFKNLGNMAQMMGQAGQIKEKLAELQKELDRLEVIGDAGAGAVRVTMSGKFECRRVDLDRTMLASLAGEGDSADQTMVEELLRSAYNDAVAKAQEAARQELSKLTGGLDIPGLDQLIGREG